MSDDGSVETAIEKPKRILSEKQKEAFMKAQATRKAKIAERAAEKEALKEAQKQEKKEKRQLVKEVVKMIDQDVSESSPPQQLPWTLEEIAVSVADEIFSRQPLELPEPPKRRQRSAPRSAPKPAIKSTPLINTLSFV